MKNILILTICLFSFPAFAWNGYDYENGTFIEIDKGNLVIEGNNIEIYDYSTGEYKDVKVQNITSYGSSVEIEVYDYDTGEYHTLGMDKQK